MFEAYENDARKFVEEIAHELHHPENHQTAIRVMTGVLHAIRDVLSVEESLHVLAQMPLYIKGIYVTGWHLGKRERIKDKDDFIERLLLENPRTGPHDFGNDEKAMENIKAVIRVVKRHLSPGETDDIIRQFPAGLKDFWRQEEIVVAHPDLQEAGRR